MLPLNITSIQKISKCFHALRARLRLVGGFARSPLANSPEALLTNTINARLEDFVIREMTFCNSNYVNSHVDTRSVVSCRSVASLILTHSSLGVLDFSQAKKNLIKRQGFFHKPSQVCQLVELPILELTVLHWIFL